MDFFEITEESFLKLQKKLMVFFFYKVKVDDIPLNFGPLETKKFEKKDKYFLIKSKTWKLSCLLMKVPFLQKKEGVLCRI